MNRHVISRFLAWPRIGERSCNRAGCGRHSVERLTRWRRRGARSQSIPCCRPTITQHRLSLCIAGFEDHGLDRTPSCLCSPGHNGEDPSFTSEQPFSSCRTLSRRRFVPRGLKSSTRIGNCAPNRKGLDEFRLITAARVIKSSIDVFIAMDSTFFVAQT